MRQVSGIRIFDRTILKFLIVGVVNTLFGTAVMFSLYNLAGCSYWISSAANYILGSILSFFLNKYFTFQNKERPWRQVVRFTVNIAACYLVAYGVAKPAVRMLLSGQSVSIQENAAMLVGMCIFTGLNCFGQRFFAFR